MHRLLCEYNHYEHDHDRCRVSTVNPKGCRQVRKDIQEMLDEGVIEILQNCDGDDEVNVISPVFRIPEPVVIRWERGAPSLYLFVNIADVNGLTRSGRVFSVPPKPQIDTRRDDIVDCVVRPVGNYVVSPNSALVASRPAAAVKTHVPTGQNGIMK
ncbi:hypothetical protein KIW84_075219 [Lathyrus oleraceus]|uniref:Uncharacterized protein n=1 Tax=Pisum sativum TaxID=3888 RepID=A0A9D4ZZ51_PEA|nr:hypothetical protein KIW84_075219 [Pisum sativum]